jgi:hypothetical protein
VEWLAKHVEPTAGFNVPSARAMGHSLIFLEEVHSHDIIAACEAVSGTTALVIGDTLLTHGQQFWVHNWRETLKLSSFAIRSAEMPNYEVMDKITKTTVNNNYCQSRINHISALQWKTVQPVAHFTLHQILDLHEVK